MTLFIASLLIYHYDMDWWWYAVAATLWAGESIFKVAMLGARQ